MQFIILLFTKKLMNYCHSTWSTYRWQLLRYKIWLLVMKHSAGLQSEHGFRKTIVIFFAVNLYCFQLPVGVNILTCYNMIYLVQESTQIWYIPELRQYQFYCKLAARSEHVAAVSTQLSSWVTDVTIRFCPVHREWAVWRQNAYERRVNVDPLMYSVYTKEWSGFKS